MSADGLPLGVAFPLGTATTTRFASGIAYVWIHTPFVVTRVEGYLSVEAAQAIEKAARKNFVDARGARVSGFHDWWEVEDYASDARTQLTALGREIEKDSDKTHILLRSRVLAFGVKAASILLSNLEVYSERPRFQLALEHAVEKATRR